MQSFGVFFISNKLSIFQWFETPWLNDTHVTSLFYTKEQNQRDINVAAIMILNYSLAFLQQQKSVYVRKG